MHPKLKTLKIEKLFGHKDIELHFNDVTVLVGKNGLGKTTLLKILHALLLRQSCTEIESCIIATLTFSDDEVINFENRQLSYVDPEGVEKTIFGDVNNHLRETLNSNLVNDYFDASKQRIKLKNRAEVEKQPSLLSLIRNFFNAKFSLSENKKYFLDSVVKVNFISTINMSANSQQILTGSDGRQGNLLDWEIEKEISDIVKTPKGKYTLAFIKEVNRHFADSGKKVQVKDGLKVITPDSKTPLPVSKLSSGERQLLYIMAKVANTKNSPAFLLMDEPEISLHLNWQEKLLDSIKTLNPNCQIVVVTHSPAVIMDGYMDSYIDMENIVVESRNV
ncbi:MULTISPECIES: AAA family ATPase [unclassified Rahnella]|uniref:AAA family ATPase n=1 Tax=unclassified Rahnella TaxID=2635087 RepID=UPI0013EEBDDA|nr:ATP-binding protein [Rahnella sp. RFA10(1/100)]